MVGSATAYPTIAAALAGAADGDTILVPAGDYREPTPLELRHRVVLRGEGRPVLHGGAGNLLVIRADSVTVTGLVLDGMEPSATEDRAAILVEGARACVIEDNELRRTFFGVYLSRATGCLVRHNRIAGQATTEVLTGNAIHGWNSRELVIQDNDLTGHRDGIYFEFVTAARVERNRSTGQLRYGLHFMFSDSCRYMGNTFDRNGSGVAVMYSHHVTMEGNTFAHSWGSAAYGLLLKEITDSRISGNRIDQNSVGLYGEGVNRVVIRGNSFTGNGWGVQILANAQDTRFERNAFAGNAFDVSTNSVHAASVFRENHWDRYTGYDLDGDGVGDVPFAPVRLFAVVVQRDAPALILLRSFFVTLLDLAERVAPVLTPRALEDPRPLLHWPAEAP